MIAIALNHENLTDAEILKIIKNYEARLRLPTTDVLNYGCQKLVQSLGDRFPKLNQKIKRDLKTIPLLAMS